MWPHGGLWGPHGAPGERGGPTAPRVHSVFARIFVIMSILAFSDDFHDFLENKLKTPILAESGERANPWCMYKLGVWGVGSVA